MVIFVEIKIPLFRLKYFIFHRYEFSFNKSDSKDCDLLQSE